MSANTKTPKRKIPIAINPSFINGLRRLRPAATPAADEPPSTSRAGVGPALAGSCSIAVGSFSDGGPTAVVAEPDAAFVGAVLFAAGATVVGEVADTEDEAVFGAVATVDEGVGAKLDLVVGFAVVTVGALAPAVVGDAVVAFVDAADVLVGPAAPTGGVETNRAAALTPNTTGRISDKRSGREDMRERTPRNGRLRPERPNAIASTIRGGGYPADVPLPRARMKAKRRPTTTIITMSITMTDKCTDADCRAVVSYPKRWHPVKGKNTEVMVGRCPDCGTNYTKSRQQGTTEPVNVTMSPAEN